MKPLTFALAVLTASTPTSSSALPNMKRQTSSSSSSATAAAAAAAAARVLMGHSGGILVADYDGSGFKVSLKESVAGIPSWMAFAQPDKLYAVDEGSNTLRLFTLDLDANKLQPKQEKSASAGVVHLEFNKDETRMVGAAYGGGTIDVWNIENGGLELIKTIDSPGELGPNTARQDAPHPHQAVLDPSGRYFAVNDLGTDSIVIIDSKDDAFDIATRVQVKPGGCGPRHGVFYPSPSPSPSSSPSSSSPSAGQATHYFVACEMKNVVQVFSLAYADNGIAFTHSQTISTFGNGTQPRDASAAALGEIVLAPNNEDLYVSNRLTGYDTDNVAHFKISKRECGAVTLKYAHTVSSGGIAPRMISLGSSSDVVFVGNPKGALGAVALERDEDGSLGERPLASIEGSVFGTDNGPQYIMQIQ